MAKKDKVTVIVLESFRDKYDHKTQYPAGTELQVERERADDLVSRGLAGIKKSEPGEVFEKKETGQKDGQGTEEQ